MRKRRKGIKEFQLQMNFVRGCNESCCEVPGAAVYRLRHGAVSPGWLSACREEQALTAGVAGIMEGTASLSNLQKAYGQVVKNGGSGGMDGMDMKGLREWVKDNIRRVAETVSGRRL